MWNISHPEDYQGGKLPTSGYMAGELDLSVAYFNDLLRFETGKTLEEYFQLKRLDIARHMLLQDGHTPAAVARKLGYPNVQCFSVFKKITGVAPVITGSRRIDNRVCNTMFCDTVPFCKMVILSVIYLQKMNGVWLIFAL